MRPADRRVLIRLSPWKGKNSCYRSKAMRVILAAALNASLRTMSRAERFWRRNDGRGEHLRLSEYESRPDRF